jgi:hypothetical protein
MFVAAIDPPERGFYAKRLDVLGTAIKAHADVADAALLEAGRRLARLLRSAPAVAANLASAGAELHVIGERQRVTDLPMYRHLAGRPREDGRTMDERARGYGGLHACCSEESVLERPTARHRDHRDVCSHEIAHMIHAYGLDATLRSLVDARYHASKPLWRSAYAAENAQEFFAELTMWYVGSRGDYTSLPSPAPGPRWLARHDPESFALLDAIYSGRLEPEAIVWGRLEPTVAVASERSDAPVSLVFVNETDRPIERFWLDFAGERRPYGPIPPGSAVGQSTYVGHPWVLVDADGDDIAVFAARSAGHAMVVVDQ